MHTPFGIFAIVVIWARLEESIYATKRAGTPTGRVAPKPATPASAPSSRVF